MGLGIKLVPADELLKDCGNAIKGTVSGAVVSMGDVSPLEHKIPVKVRSKNLIPYPYRTNTTTIDGVTFTDNGDGTITLNGTATADIIYAPILAVNNLYLEAGTYTFSDINVGNYGTMYLQGKLVEDSTFNVAVIGTSKTFTITKGDLFRFNIRIANGASFSDMVVKPQLEPGATTTPYTPYVSDDAEITVKSCGGNLFDMENAQKFSGNAVPEKIDNGIVVSHTGASSFISANFELPSSLEGKKITIRADVSTSAENDTCLRVMWLNGASAKGGSLMTPYHSGQTVQRISKTGIVPAKPSEEYNCLCLMLYANANVALTEQATRSATFRNIQVALGESTEYEPFNEGETVHTIVGETVELNRIAPNMTITTDTTGALVECTYNKDTAKIIEKLTQAIISLGGNI